MSDSARNLSHGGKRGRDLQVIRSGGLKFGFNTHDAIIPNIKTDDGIYGEQLTRSTRMTTSQELARLGDNAGRKDSGVLSGAGQSSSW